MHWEVEDIYRWVLEEEFTIRIVKPHKSIYKLSDSIYIGVFDELSHQVKYGYHNYKHIQRLKAILLHAEAMR